MIHQDIWPRPGKRPSCFKLFQENVVQSSEVVDNLDTIICQGHFPVCIGGVLIVYGWLLSDHLHSIDLHIVELSISDNRGLHFILHNVVMAGTHIYIKQSEKFYLLEVQLNGDNVIAN